MYNESDDLTKAHTRQIIYIPLTNAEDAELNPEYIRNNTEVRAYLTTYNTIKNRYCLYEVTLPYHKYADFIDVLIDMGHYPIQGTSRELFYKWEEEKEIPAVKVGNKNFNPVIKSILGIHNQQ